MNASRNTDQHASNAYILNSISEAVIVTDVDGKIIYWNKAAEELYKWKSKEVIGKNILEVTPSTTTKKQAEEIMNSLKKGNSWEGEFEVRDKNGKKFPVLVKDSPLLDSKNNLIGIIGNSRDITNYKKAEQELKENERNFRILSDNTFDWEYWIDPKGNYIYMSPSCERITGYGRHEFIKNPDLLFEITVAEYKEQVQNHYNPITEKDPHTEIFQIINKNKEKVWIEHSCLPVYDKKGTFRGRRGVNRDITKQKQAELKLRATEENLRKTFDVSPSIICTVNLNTGYFINASKAVTRILGYTNKEFTSIPIMELIHPDDRQRTMDEVSKQLTGDETISFENRYLCKNGSYKWVTWNASAADEQGLTTAVCSDINKRKMADIELKKAKLEAKEKEEKHRTITENIPGMVYRARSDWSVDTMMNSELITGYDEKDFVSGKVSWLNIIHPNDKDRVLSKSKLLLNNEARLTQEYSIITKEKSVRHIADYKHSIFKNGKLAFIDGVVLDKTTQHEIEEKLKLSDRVFNLSLDMFCIAGFDGYFKYLNPSWERMLGWSVAELLSKPWLEFVYPEDVEKTENVKSVIVDGKEIYQFENRYICKDGSIKWLSWNSQPFPAENIMIGAVRDITKSKEIENELVKAKEKAEENEKELLLAKKIVEKNTEMILNSQAVAHICSYSTNLNENNIEKSSWVCSPEFYKIFGIDETYPHTIAGWANLIHPDYRDKLVAYHESVVKNRSSFNHEYKIIRINDGVERWVKGTGELVYDEQGKPIRMYGSIQDITESKQIENELIHAKEKAEESDRLKSAFLANMSHEIRTPMNGILGFTDLLKEPGLSGKQQQKFIGIIEKSGDRMLHTINDIVDISKIEAGQVDITISEFNLNKQLDELFEFFFAEARKKNIKLSVTNKASNRLATIKSDKDKLDSILTNFIKNALKYTHAGSIDFGYTLNEKSGQHELEFYVNDTGIGISKERQKAVFDRFIQADIEDKQVYEGSGLGLAISKAYVEMLGGKIWVESEEGVGSQFYFAIPYKPGESKTSKKNAAAS